jgi:Ni/Fe-hydrogenase subunit HybB-like protein
LFFFASAVAVGMAMVIFESQLSCRAFGHGIETELLSKVAKGIPYALGVYLALKAIELAVTGEFGLLFTSGWYSVLYWAEITIGAIIPIVLFTRRSVRESQTGLLIGAAFVIVGLMFNRFNVSLFALEHQGGQVYVPSWMELAVSFGIISGGVLLFAFVARFFPLFESEEHATGH